MLAHRFFPLTTFEDLRGEMDRVFDAFGRTDGGSMFPRTRALPAVNVWEDGSYIYVEAEVPGMKMDDLGVEVLGRELKITGSRAVERTEGTTFHRQERSYGEFTRSLSLNTDVDPEKVEARLKDGVLTITMPKADTAKARRITVKSE
jgi:HSP20 family protein